MRFKDVLGTCKGRKYGRVDDFGNYNSVPWPVSQPMNHKISGGLRNFTMVMHWKF